MKISNSLTEEVILRELGQRLARARLEHDLTQAELADEAGVSKRTVERLESGQVATQLSGLLRVCRALGLLDRFDVLVPEAVPGPMARLKQKGRERKRAKRKKVDASPREWTWGEQS